MKILFAASECAPFIKTGGLADVVGALPKALASHGADVRVMLPLYPALAAVADGGEEVLDLGALMGYPARLIAAEAAGLKLLLLEAPHLYDRAGGGPYLTPEGQDWPDNPQRFAALGQAVARLVHSGADGWFPDLVHAHDWQAALGPWFLKQADSLVPSLTSIHNVAFQGLADAALGPSLGLDMAGFHADGFEYYGSISFLKAGLVASDRISTVSPTYARELMLPEFGMGLDGVIAARGGDLSGIVNGIDTEIWNPATDPDIPAPYGPRSLTRKARNRAALAKRFGLSPSEDAPLFCVISRLTRQKGLDLLIDALPALLGRGARLALLGTGDADLESAFCHSAETHPGQIGVVIGYDEALSHLMQAGADAILIPSRFEPCGLTQLYGLRYGTLPVVARTGGLADTVIDANHAALAAGTGTGVQFAPVTQPALEQAILRTCDLYADRKLWAALTRRAMRQPVGWEDSAAQYMTLYQDILSAGAEASA
ncbi:MAG: glycogen synthase GlgA [Rhodobacteraceae bacterium]|nr:glycogen synthase GlgA [Paracoccaceae bacterium]